MANYVDQCIGTCIKLGAHSATKFISDKAIVRATRRLVNGRIDKRYNAEFAVTIGRPNFREREFIKDCKAAGVKFPISKVWVHYPPKRKPDARQVLPAARRGGVMKRALWGFFEGAFIGVCAGLASHHYIFAAVAIGSVGVVVSYLDGKYGWSE